MLDLTTSLFRRPQRSNAEAAACVHGEQWLRFQRGAAHNLTNAALQGLTPGPCDHDAQMSRATSTGIPRITTKKIEIDRHG